MRLRVLHAPCLAAGNAGQLAKAERAVGLASWSLSVDPNPYGFPVDEQLSGPASGRLAFELQRWRLLGRALRDFDVVHFNFGRTLFPNALQVDLPILKATGKAIFMTFQGDDARQGDYCSKHFGVTFASRVPADYFTPRSDAEKRKRIAWIGRFADGIYALNPDLLNVLPPRARFLPYANIDLESWKPVPYPANDEPVLVHAPTHRAVKGTDVILDAVGRLQAEGERFKLVLIENMPREKVRRAYEQADLAIDQLYAGWYGGFAVEMMALAKPVLCYLRASDFRFLPEGMAGEIPIVTVEPATVYETLKTWLRAPRERRQEIGRWGRAYVEKWHDPRRVATSLKADYEAALGRRAA